MEFSSKYVNLEAKERELLKVFGNSVVKPRLDNNSKLIKEIGHDMENIEITN